MTALPSTTLADYDYVTEDDTDADRDCRKMSHELVHRQTGERFSIDFTPYDRMTPAALQGWLDRGGPGRSGIGPLCNDDLERRKA